MWKLPTVPVWMMRTGTTHRVSYDEKKIYRQFYVKFERPKPNPLGCEGTRNQDSEGTSDDVTT